MKEIQQSFLLTIFLSFILLSCEKDFNVDRKEDKIVLNSSFSPDTNLILNINNTKFPYSSNSIDTYSDYKIVLKSHSEIINEFKKLGNGLFLIDMKPKVGEKYSINISRKNYLSIASSSKIPENVKIDSFSKSIIYNNENEKNLRLTLNILSTKRSFLILKHIEYNQIVSLNNDTIPFVDTVWIQGNGNFSEVVLPSYANSKYVFFKLEPGENNISLQSYGGFIKDENIVSGISKIELYTCSKDYYEYQKSRVLYNWNNKGINTSIINSTSLYDNIENGLGIFAGYNKQILLDTFK